MMTQLIERQHPELTCPHYRGCEYWLECTGRRPCQHHDLTNDEAVERSDAWAEGMEV